MLQQELRHGAAAMLANAPSTIVMSAARLHHSASQCLALPGSTPLACCCCPAGTRCLVPSLLRSSPRSSASWRSSELAKQQYWKLAQQQQADTAVVSCHSSSSELTWHSHELVVSGVLLAGPAQAWWRDAAVEHRCSRGAGHVTEHRRAQQHCREVRFEAQQWSQWCTAGATVGA